MDSKIKIAIFASGSGTNAMNLINKALGMDLEIPLLICDRPQAAILNKLEGSGTKAFLLPIEGDDFSQAKKEQEKKILTLLKEYQIDWIFLAGYMRILSADFIKEFWDDSLQVNRIVNIHPSLLPSFPGKDGYGDAFAAQVDESGITIHFVDSGVDTGPIIVQKKFKRESHDTLESFKKRGLTLEHQMYAEVLAELNCEKTLKRRSL